MSRKKIKKNRVRQPKPEDFVAFRKKIRKMINNVDRAQEELDRLVTEESEPSINIDEEFCDIT
jgi:hypothetical protein